mmetsp:Transcript_92123/g.210942  ORF Transcript_92123/g.210942 Transcript_92123/m.210942 type:complete len:214 (+) Transcript_92123:106-747(+)
MPAMPPNIGFGFGIAGFGGWSGSGHPSGLVRATSSGSGAAGDSSTTAAFFFRLFFVTVAAEPDGASVVDTALPEDCTDPLEPSPPVSCTPVDSTGAVDSDCEAFAMLMSANSSSSSSEDSSTIFSTLRWTTLIIFFLFSAPPRHFRCTSKFAIAVTILPHNMYATSISGVSISHKYRASFVVFASARSLRVAANFWLIIAALSSTSLMLRALK